MQSGLDAAARLASHFTDEVLRSLALERRVEIARGLFSGLDPPLLSRGEIESALALRQIRAGRVRAYMGRTELDLERLRIVHDGDVNLPVLRQVLAQGATLLINRLERRIPALHGLAAALEERLGVRIQIPAVLSFGARSGLKAHHDMENVFIVQVEGTKDWRFLGEPVEPGLTRDAFSGEEGAPRDITLEAGDVMFLPAGQRHVCNASPDFSLHLGVLLEAPTALPAGDALAAAVAADPAIGAPYLPFLAEPDRAGAVAGYRRRLHELVDELDLEGIIEGKRPRPKPGGFAFPEPRSEE